MPGEVLYSHSLLGDGSVPGAEFRGAAAPEVEARAPREAWLLLFSPQFLAAMVHGIIQDFDLSPVSCTLKP